MKRTASFQRECRNQQLLASNARQRRRTRLQRLVGRCFKVQSDTAVRRAHIATMKIYCTVLMVALLAAVCVNSQQSPRPWKTARCPNGGRFWVSCNECACPTGEVECHKETCKRPYDKCPQPMGTATELRGGCGELCVCDEETLITSCDGRCAKTLIENFYPWE